MSPSEKIRALLDERGIEWQSGAFGDPRITYWNSNGVEWCAIEHVDGRLVVNMGIDITPEQAIAATVGNRTDLSKQLRKVHGLHEFAELFGFSWEDGSDWSWHDVACAMADAVDAATVGNEPWEPSKEWKAWHESLRHDNPTNVREVVESILFDAIEFGGDMGPNGNVWSGVDEGDVLTDGCINGWVQSIEEIAATLGEEHETHICKRCGVAYELSIIDKGFGKPRFCPNCGARRSTNG